MSLVRRHPLLVSLAIAWFGLGSLVKEGVASMTQTTATKSVLDRGSLASLRSWTHGSASVLLPGSATQPAKMQSVDVRTAYYSTKVLGIGLALLTEPTTKVTYVVLSEQSFYVNRPQGLVSCLVDAGIVTVRDSLFKSAAPNSGDDEVLARFLAAVSDDGMAAFTRQAVHINIKSGIPGPFWSKRGGDDSQVGLPQIAGVDLSGDILRLDLVGGGGQKGTFWIDMAALKLTKSLLR
jgi:hypothetical protein